MNVENEYGETSVKSGGIDQAIAINNRVTKIWPSCGISTEVDGKLSKLCAFPLNGLTVDTLWPIEKVLLVFSTDPVSTGTVIAKMQGAGLLIDLTGVEAREVTYDLTNSWTFEEGAAWATKIPPMEELNKYLIEEPTDIEAVRYFLWIKMNC